MILLFAFTSPYFVSEAASMQCASKGVTFTSAGFTRNLRCPFGKIPEVRLRGAALQGGQQRFTSFSISDRAALPLYQANTLPKV